MTPDAPHYLLFSEARQDETAFTRWRFVLQNVRTHRRFSATDAEPCCEGSERCELLAVVRGLEALDRPSHVTLVTKSRYVCRGIKQGLREWRENGWRWEHFGRIVPIRDHDLWQRVDRAMRFHNLVCQAWQFDVTEDTQSESTYLESADLGRSQDVAGLPSVKSRRVMRPRARSHTRQRWTDRISETFDVISRPVRLPLGSSAAS